MGAYSSWSLWKRINFCDFLILERENERSNPEVPICLTEVSSRRIWRGHETVQWTTSFSLSQFVSLPKKDKCKLWPLIPILLTMECFQSGIGCPLQIVGPPIWFARFCEPVVREAASLGWPWFGHCHYPPLKMLRECTWVQFAVCSARVVGSKCKLLLPPFPTVCCWHCHEWPILRCKSKGHHKAQHRCVIICLLFIMFVLTMPVTGEFVINSS